MTEEQIKAAVSAHFVQLIASRAGFKCKEPSPDHGCDLVVTRAIKLDRNGHSRYLDSGEYVDIQLKSTTEKQVIRTATTVRYDLEAKSYNDLVFRRNSNRVVPLILVVLVLPDDTAQWVTVTTDELIVRRAAYWYLPPVGATETDNVATIRIEIPNNQVVDLSFVSDRFQEAYQ